MTYVLTHEHAIAFYNKHKEIDFNVMNGVLVDMMDSLIHNMSDNIESGQNTEFFREISKRLGTLEISVTQNENKLSVMLAGHLDNLLKNMRDTVKSNNTDTERAIVNQIQSNHELFLSKVNSLSKDDSLRAFVKEEMERMNTSLRTETGKVLSGMENSSVDQVVDKVNKMITEKYNDLDSTFKARIDSFFSSQSSTHGSMYSEIMSRLEKTTSAVDQVGDYFKKQSGSTNKGKQGEAKLELLLSKMLPSASIQNTSGLTACGDFIIERIDKQKILIDTKDYETVVPVKEVEKLIRDAEGNGCHGILLSQNSGIAQKNDFEINVHNHKIVLFIHNAKYNEEKLMMAFNIIDYLEPHIREKDDDGGESISTDLLALINKEYQDLATQKLNLIQTMKKMHQELVTQVQKLDLPVLTSYLDKKFANTGKTGLLCDICSIFMGKNAKSLAAHRRRCTPTNAIINTEMDNVN